MSRLIEDINRLFAAIPQAFILFLARISVAATFWRSGQTKIEGFRFDPVAGQYQFDWPELSRSALFLFREEYRLPLIDPYWAAVLAAFAEHLFPLLLLVGLVTRLSALALLIMTAVIQILVYPQAWVTHGLWATALLLLMSQGAGRFSLDSLLRR